MAKPRNGSGDKKTETTAPTFEVPEVSIVQNLIKTCGKYAKKISTLTAELREAIGNAVEKKGVHKGVLAAVRKLDDKEPEELAEWFAHFDVYAKPLRDRAATARRLPMGDEVEDETGDGEDAPGNVRRLATARAPRQPGADVG